MKKLERLEKILKNELENIEHSLIELRKELNETIDETTRDMIKDDIELLKGKWLGIHESLYYIDYVNNTK